VAGGARAVLRQIKTLRPGAGAAPGMGIEGSTHPAAGQG
jgi:hypothetical protein